MTRYLDDLLNIDKWWYLFWRTVNQIYPSKPQLDKANSSDTEAPFLDLHLTILDVCFLCVCICLFVCVCVCVCVCVFSKIYEKSDDFEIDIVNFPFLDGDIPRDLYIPTYSVC